MAAFELNPGERVFADTNRYTFQGKKVKFPVYCRCIVTDQRFVYFDMGRMVPFYFQLGFLLRLMVKGKPVSIPLHNLKLARGKYVKNNRLLRASGEDGREVLLDRYEKSLDWIQSVLAQNGVALSRTGEEEWQVSF